MCLDLAETEVALRALGHTRDALVLRNRFTHLANRPAGKPCARNLLLQALRLLQL